VLLRRILYGLTAAECKAGVILDRREST